MRVALIGGPSGGKTTLFCLLTGTDYAQALQSTGQTRTGVTRVADPRLQRLHVESDPGARVVTPTVELVDTPSLTLGGGEGSEKTAALLGSLREVDGYVAMVPVFETSGRPLAERAAAAGGLRENLRAELLMADLGIAEKRIEKLQAGLKKPMPGRELDQQELEILQRIRPELENGRTEVFGKLRPEEAKRLRGFQFFSQKPVLWFYNLADGDASDAALAQALDPDRQGGFICPLRLEQELLQLPEDERRTFQQEYGITEMRHPDLPRQLFDRLGYHVFMTAGKETRAWPIRKGDDAVAAAAKIHNDLARGFICVEVCGFSDWEACGSLKDARSRGKYRQEGKAYVMKDGDIVVFKAGTARG